MARYVKKKGTKKVLMEVEVATTGRPTKYDPKFCETVKEVMAKGFSKEAVAGHLKINKDTLYKWVERHEEFANAIKDGMELSRLFWESIAINHLTHTKNSKQLNSVVWLFNMKNRFNWTDKKEIELGEKTTSNIKLAYSLDSESEEEESVEED